MVSYFERSDTFALDLETTGLNPIDSSILLCQIGFPDKIYVIDGDVSLNPILPFFSSHKWTKIVQNAKFESKFIEYIYKTSLNRVYDTFSAEKIIEPDAFSASLETLALKYCGIVLEKETRKSFYMRGKGGGITKKQLDYAAKDVEVLFPIMEAQMKKLEEQNQMQVAQLEFDLSRVVAHMELVGIPVDTAKWRETLEQYRVEHEESRVRMNGLIFDSGKKDEQMGMFVRDGINLNSVPQMKSAFAALGINLESTAERTIAQIKHPLAVELLKYRELQKVMSSYGKSFLDAIHPFTGRIHPDFVQIGAETGRFACREPNMQQVPKRFRECIGNVPNYTLVGADYSQIELRIIAELSGDDRLRSAFQSNQDVHRMTASVMFGTPLDNVSDDQRFIAKTINFGLAYGMGGRKLMDTINANTKGKKLTIKDAYILLDKHKKTYPKVISWLRETGERAYRESVSQTIFGRKRFYRRPDRSALSNEDFDDQVAAIKRRGGNTPIQGTSADITKLAMINVYKDLLDYQYNGDLILQVHDELVILAHKRQAESVKELVEKSMVDAAKVLLLNTPVKVDVHVSDIWKK